MLNKPNFDLTVVANIDGVSKIESNMEAVKQQALRIRDWYASLVITEDMIKDIKNEKAELNKTKKIVADYRKDIIKEFKKPIDQFEALAKETEKILEEAYNTCTQAVNQFEEETKTKKTEEVKEYFDEYARSLNIDFVAYEQANINVTLTASMKSLRETAKGFLDKINDDLTLINTQDENLISEIIVEYKRSLNASCAIITVKERYKAIEEEKARQEALKEFKAKAIKQEKKVEEIIAPKEIEEKPQLYKASFNIVGTIEQIKKLKQFMNEEGIKYDTN